MVRGSGKSAFEEAIFILRHDTGLSEQDFLSEAERLIAEHAGSMPPVGKRRGTVFLIFSLAFVCLLLGWAVHLMF